MSTTCKITQLDGVTLNGTSKLADNKLQTSSGNTITFQNKAGTVALTTDIPSLTSYVTTTGTQTLTNKTLTTPKISTIINGGYWLSLPAKNGILATTDDIQSSGSSGSSGSVLDLRSMSASEIGEYNIDRNVTEILYPWDNNIYGNLESLDSYFMDCAYLKDFVLGSTQLSFLRNMNCMFMNCVNLRSVSFLDASFNILTHTSGMFVNDKLLKCVYMPCAGFDQLSTTNAMFEACHSLTDLYLQEKAAAKLKTIGDCGLTWSSSVNPNSTSTTLRHFTVSNLKVTAMD